MSDSQNLQGLQALGERRQDDSGRHTALGSDAVILAGVHSWGGCPLERVVPRPLVPVAGKPLISHVVSWLREQGFDRARICANSDTVRIWRKLGDGSDLDIRLEYYEDVTPRGPAGCVRDAVQHTSPDTVLAVDGTIIPDVDVESLMEAHKASGAVLTVGVAGSTGSDFSEQGNLRPVGIYVFSRSALDTIPATGYQDIKEGLIPALHTAGHKVLAFPVGEQSVARVSGVASYLAVSKHIVEMFSRRGLIPSGYGRRGEALIHESAVIDPTAQLIGPVLVEAGCVVGPNAIIVGPTSLGVSTHVEQGAVVTRSAVWAGCVIGRSATVDNSILADRARIAELSAVRGIVCVSPRPAAAKAGPRSFKVSAGLLEPQSGPAAGRMVSSPLAAFQQSSLSRPEAVMPLGARRSEPVSAPLDVE